MGHLEESLKYFEKELGLTKELHESNPGNISLLKGLGISYYKLSMINKAMGDDEKGKEYFSHWKNIISLLAENLPQVPKYREWNRLEY